jgi:hypothetical protein
MGVQGPPGKDGSPGPKGPTGETGPRGIGIKTINISGSGDAANLTVTLTDDTVIPLGNVRGPKGEPGAVNWGDLTPEQKTSLASSLSNITAELNTQASNGTGVFATGSNFQTKLKSFIVDKLNEEAKANINDDGTLKSPQTGLFSTDTNFKKWLDANQKGTSLYCANGSCVDPDSKFKLQYITAIGGDPFSEELRLYSSTSAKPNEFALGIKNGNIRTDGILTASTVSAKTNDVLTLRSGMGSATATLQGDTLSVNNGNIQANTLQLPNGWAIATDSISLRILKGGQDKLTVFNGGKILAQTGYGVKAGDNTKNYIFTSNWNNGNLGVSRAGIDDWTTENRGEVREL